MSSVWPWFAFRTYLAFKEVRRNDVVGVIEAIERDEIDVVIICDVDHLTGNLPDWSRCERAARGRLRFVRV